MTKIETIIFTIESLPSQNKLLEGTHSIQDILFLALKSSFFLALKSK